jgi:glutathione S-transferase
MQTEAAMAQASYHLIVGTKAWSSWSLRPWLLMRHAGIPFEETVIGLREPGTRAAIEKHSPSGKVPYLKADGLGIWDSLAIAEHLAEAHPEKRLWPEDRAARAHARAVSAEMHSGFAELRGSLPMDFNARKPLASIPAGAAGDIGRIVAIWRGARNAYGKGGPFLFGAFSIADAMYAPVCSRFTTYAVDLRVHGDDGTAEAYRAMMMRLPAMAEWGEGA